MHFLWMLIMEATLLIAAFVCMFRRGKPASAKVALAWRLLRIP
jgi:hypothetical protein